jgi:osmotically-inducible protein OsmY
MRLLMLVVLTAASISTSAFAQKMTTEPVKAATSPTAVSAKAVVQDAKQDVKQDSKTTAKEVKQDTKEAKMKATETAKAFDDASIEKAVSDKLASLPSLKDTKITVKVSGGTVMLTGTVAKPGLKGVATNAAKRIAGVKKVDNQITVEQKK